MTVSGARFVPKASIKQAEHTLEMLPVLRRWVMARINLAGNDVDLSLRQYTALRVIQDGATSPGELARLWQVTPAVITGIIDRLERRGLVRREPDPIDRRRLRLALTPAGLAASEAVERALIDDLADQLASASPDELAELGRALDLLQRTFAALEARASNAGLSRQIEGDLIGDEQDLFETARDERATAEASRRALVGSRG